MAKILSIYYYFSKSLQTAQQWTDCFWFRCLKHKVAGLCWRVNNRPLNPPPPPKKEKECYVNIEITFSAARCTLGSQKELEPRQEQTHTSAKCSFPDVFIEWNGRCTWQTFEITLFVHASFLSPPPLCGEVSSLSTCLSVSDFHGHKAF